MADIDRRIDYGNFNGGYNKRKRRYRDDGGFDERQQRRRYEEPVHAKLRRQLLRLGDGHLQRTEEEIPQIAKLITEHYQEENIKYMFLTLMIQLITEQPLKIPFLAGVALASDQTSPEVVSDLVINASTKLESAFEQGRLVEAKLYLRFLACLQGALAGDGVLPLLETMFSRAVDLQTASSEDSLGLEIVKIILLTLPFLMSVNTDKYAVQALSLLEKTDVIASTPHPLYALVDPINSNDKPISASPCVVGLLQKQLQAEAENGWRLACVMRPWNPLQLFDTADEAADAKEERQLPEIKIPSPIFSDVHPRLPDIFFSVYSEQDVHTVPPTSDLASSLIRDLLVDAINLTDFNRGAVAKFLIDVDNYFPENTFTKRSAPFDKLRELDEGQSTWKPEDVALDAVFSQMLRLPFPDHKQVFYHAVLTEACKIAPTAIAPSLGRAIRSLYQKVDVLDLELAYRFLDWFSHHLSNFGFSWKWTEWNDDLELSPLHPKRSFINGVLDKEMRLSFASRIRGTLPEDFQFLIGEEKDQDIPPFKFEDDQLPYADSARQLLQLLKTKAPDEELKGVFDTVEAAAKGAGMADDLVPSTDVLITTMCYVGSKSLSHVLSQIERCKTRLHEVGKQSEAARRQIITSVMDYWKERPGVGLAIIEKLLNYTILTPLNIVEWALADQLQSGEILAETHIFELVFATLAKVTRRVRDVVTSRNEPSLLEAQRSLLDETLAKERQEVSRLFDAAQDALVGLAQGWNDTVLEGEDDHASRVAYLKVWAQRWLRTIKLRRAVEEAWVLEALASAPRNVTKKENGDETSQSTG